MEHDLSKVLQVWCVSLNLNPVLSGSKPRALSTGPGPGHPMSS